MGEISSSIEKKTEALIEDLEGDSALLEAYKNMSLEEVATSLIERGFTVDELNVIQESEYEGFNSLLNYIQIEPQRRWWF